MSQNSQMASGSITDFRESLWKKIWRNKHSYLLMAPFLTFFLIFTLLPVLISFILSFTYFNMLQFPEWRGWMNYVRLFLDDDIMIIAVRNTLIFAFLTGPVSYVLCLFFAWFINDLPPKLRALFTVIFYAPSISGTVFVIWSFIFSSDAYGLINGALMKWGILHEPVKWLLDPQYTIWVLILVQLWLSLGTGFLAFIAGLQGVDQNLYEAGAIDGISNRFQELWYITLPSMAPQLMFGAVIQIIGAFSVGSISMTLAGFPSTNYSAETIITHIIDYGQIRYEMGYASAIATMLFIAMFFSQRIITKLISRIGS